MAWNTLKQINVLRTSTRCLITTSSRIRVASLGGYEVSLYSGLPIHVTYSVLIFYQAVISHEEKTRELSKACSYIADVLPRSELTLILYPNMLVKEAVALLYARILKFLVHAVKWYKRGRINHIITSISKPWALSFKEDVESIEEQSRRVILLSNDATKSELRHLHLEVIDLKEESKETRLQLQQLSVIVKTEFNKLVELFLSMLSYSKQAALLIREQPVDRSKTDYY